MSLSSLFFTFVYLYFYNLCTFSAVWGSFITKYINIDCLTEIVNKMKSNEMKM